MGTKIDKFQEMIDRLKKQSKPIIIPEEQFAQGMKLMNESVQKTEDEYFLIMFNSKIGAAGVIVR